MQPTVTVHPYRLADGTLVLIRRIRPEDTFALATAMEAMSAESRLKRFLTPKPRLSRRELHYLTEVDFTDHYAVIAVYAHRPSAIVASARWVRDPEHPAQAEVAMAVADSLHGKGLGSHMGEVLVAAARERGIEDFTATMLYDNRAAHALLRRVRAQLRSGAVAVASAA